MGESSSNATRPNDFVTHNFIEKGQHNRDINGVKKRLAELEGRVGNNETFAKSLAECLNTQTVAADALAASVNKLIDTNSNTKESLQKFVRSDHVHNILSFLKSFGGALFWAIIGALVTYFIPKLFGGE